MKKVKIVDAIMGSGKTHDAIELMKCHKGKFVYVTPFLDEVDRIKQNVPGVVDPVVRTENLPDGINKVIYKRDDLLTKANQGLNMATTHSLFKSLKRSDYSHFTDHHLILDEVMMPIDVLDMTKDDIEIAFNEGLLVENKRTGEVSYTGDEYNGKFYKKLKSYCDTANVIYVGHRLLVWAFPPEIFKNFKSVSVLTYLFEGSILAAYFRYYEIEYEVQKIEVSVEKAKKDDIKKFLNVYIGSSNSIGNAPTAFSVNWLKSKSDQELKSISKKVCNLVQRNFRTRGNLNGYTTFKAFKSKLKGKGYTSGFIPVNERATNKYSDKETLIYLANRFLNPDIKEFFRQGGIKVDEEQWALAELIQWVWRGRIRKNESMNLFIPSKRMRNLLMDWVDEQTQEEEVKDAA